MGCWKCLNLYILYKNRNWSSLDLNKQNNLTSVIGYAAVCASLFHEPPASERVRRSHACKSDWSRINQVKQLKLTLSEASAMSGKCKFLDLWLTKNCLVKEPRFRDAGSALPAENQLKYTPWAKQLWRATLLEHHTGSVANLMTLSLYLVSIQKKDKNRQKKVQL